VGRGIGVITVRLSWVPESTGVESVAVLIGMTFVHLEIAVLVDPVAELSRSRIDLGVPVVAVPIGDGVPVFVVIGSAGMALSIARVANLARSVADHLLATVDSATSPIETHLSRGADQGVARRRGGVPAPAPTARVGARIRAADAPRVAPDRDAPRGARHCEAGEGENKTCTCSAVHIFKVARLSRARQSASPVVLAAFDH
jgi:hypothetical protein